MQIIARKVVCYEEMQDPGDFMWHFNEQQEPLRMTFLCPCGCGSYGGVAVAGDATKHPIWQWDGNLESPTIQPSIRFLGGCGWHGFLTNGSFVSC